jgi:hypothetical protein
MQMRVRHVLTLGATMLCAVIGAVAAPIESSAAVAIMWNAPTPNLSSVGMPTAVSCPSTTFCMIVDASGQAVKFDGSWHKPVHVGGTLTMISCSSRYFCMAGDRAGQTFRYANGTWKNAGTLAFRFDGQSPSIDCLRSTKCIAVGARKAARWNGSQWVQITTVLGSGQTFTGVSCASDSFCMALSNGPSSITAVWKFDGTTWYRQARFLPGYIFLGISCSSPSFCAAVGSTFALETFNGHRWTSSAAGTPVSDTLFTVSCPTLTSCMAVGYSGLALRWSGDRWLRAHRIGTGDYLTGVSCATATYCVAVDGMGARLLFNGTGWSHRYVDPTHGPLADISCAPGGALCVGIDEAGNAARYTPTGGWSGITRVDPHADPAFDTSATISCPSATFCLLGDSRSYVRKRTPDGWVSVARAPFATLQPSFDRWKLSCSSSTFCMGLAEDGYSSYFNGTGWSPVKSVPAVSDGVFWTLSCASRTFCVAANWDGAVSRWNGTGWSQLKVFAPTAVLESVTCAPTSFCLLQLMDSSNGYAEYTYVSTGGSWSKQGSLPTPGSSVVSCASATLCLGADQNGSVWQFDGSQWSSPAADVLGSTDQPTGLSCGSPHLCAAWNATKIAVTVPTG